MSDRPALIAGSDGRNGHLRLEMPKYLRLDVAPIGMVPGTAWTYNPGATPPYTAPPVGGSTVLRKIDPPAVFLSPGFDLKWTLKAASLGYYRAAVGDTLSFILYKVARSGVAGAGQGIYSVLSAAGGFTTTGAWASWNETLGTPVVLDFSAYSYYCIWEGTPTGAGDVKCSIGSYLSVEVQGVL